jgi:ribosome assembly protein YihI (activator of Der GTPase)
VNGTFEGDLIRPLGLVTLYCAYAEEELDNLLQALSAVEPFDNRQRQWTVGQKFARAERLIQQLESDDLLAGLRDALTEGRRLFERRNDFVHRSLYAGGRLVSNRAGVQEEHVTAQDLTAFAESVFAWKERIWLSRQKDLLQALADRSTEKRRPGQ